MIDDILLPALAAWPGIFATDLLRYLLAAGLAFVVLWLLLPGRLAHRRIQGRRPGARELWREFAYSMATVVIFSLNGVGIYLSVRAGSSQIYTEIGQYGWPWLVASLALTIVLHDAYFYWAHRLMHHPLLFRRLHRTHHRSRTPSPWAAYAFHPAEAVVQAAFFAIVTHLLPLHPLAMFVFLVHMILRNVIGHCGFELFPRGTPGRPLLGLLTTVTHHDLHHSRGRGNYGLYFTWWDRLMSTERADYPARFDAVTTRRPADRRAPANTAAASPSARR